MPPRVLVEAGHMAICNSSAWDNKIAANAWWVFEHQVLYYVYSTAQYDLTQLPFSV